MTIGILDWGSGGIYGSGGTGGMVVCIISGGNVRGMGDGVVWALCCMGVWYGCEGVGVMTVVVGYDGVGRVWVRGAVEGVVGSVAPW
jgi:hypothetical protein